MPTSHARSPEPQTAAPPPFRLAGITDAWWAVAATGIALLGATVALQLWHLDLGVPTFTAGDSRFQLSVARNMEETGGWYTTPQLGAPFGQELFDFPRFAVLGLLLVRGFVALTGDAIAAVNLFIVSGFVLIPLTTYYAARRLALDPLASLVISVIYTWLPYHFLRLEGGHVYLAMYAAVPLACFLVIQHTTGRPTIVRPPGGARARVIEAVLITVLIAASSLYYAAFFMLLVVAGGVLSWTRRAAGTIALGTLGILSLTSLVLVASIAPALVHAAEFGRGGAVSRDYVDSEIFSLKLVSLVLPVPDHRWGVLDFLRDNIATSPIRGEGPESLGLITALSMIALLVLAARSLVLRSIPRAPVTTVSALLIVALLTATTGGLGAIVAASGLTIIRSWARMYVFVAFFSLVGAGLWLQSRVDLGGHLARNSLVGAVIIGLALFDQTTPRMVPDYEQRSSDLLAMKAYTQSLSEEFGAGAMVFQMPYHAFPESGYSQLDGYIAGSDLRWSFGGMRGRESDWQRNVSLMSVPSALVAAAIMGFDAIEIDRREFVDGGAATRLEVERYLAAPVVESEDGALLAFDLRPVRARLVAQVNPTGIAEYRERLLAAPVLDFGSDFVGGHLAAVVGARRAVPSGRGVLSIRTPSGPPPGGPISITVSAETERGILHVETPETQRTTSIGPSVPEVITLPLPPPGETTHVVVTLERGQDLARSRPGWYVTNVSSALEEELAHLADEVAG